MRSKRRIDATLPDAVQYLYILHKSGANQYEAVKSLSENAAYFGDAAAEFSRVISDTELGIGIHEALNHLSLDTPSKNSDGLLQDMQHQSGQQEMQCLIWKTWYHP